MKFKTIFVGGVHGVGKGYLIESLKKQNEIWHLTASSIIRDEKSGETDRNKIVVDAENNQDFLVRGLTKIKTQANLLLLDGHFCLQKEYSIYKIPLDTFSKINLSKIFLVQAAPEQILKNQKARDRTSFSKSMIEELILAEANHAKYIASSLSVPIEFGDSNDLTRLSEFIR